MCGENIRLAIGRAEETLQRREDADEKKPSPLSLAEMLAGFEIS
jgi:hypothetical protein